MKTLASPQPRPAVADAVLLQRLEGLVVLASAIAVYFWLGQSWLVFALLFLAPDLFMLGYLRGKRTGALVYNLGHTYAAPAVLVLLGLTGGGAILYGLCAIWVAHIGFDRMLGYGFKLGDFKQTHLSRG